MISNSKFIERQYTISCESYMNKDATHSIKSAIHDNPNPTFLVFGEKSPTSNNIAIAIQRRRIIAIVTNVKIVCALPSNPKLPAAILIPINKSLHMFNGICTDNIEKLYSLE